MGLLVQFGSFSLVFVEDWFLGSLLGLVHLAVSEQIQIKSARRTWKPPSKLGLSRSPKVALERSEDHGAPDISGRHLRTGLCKTAFLRKVDG